MRQEKRINDVYLEMELVKIIGVLGKSEKIFTDITGKTSIVELSIFLSMAVERCLIIQFLFTEILRTGFNIQLCP